MTAGLNRKPILAGGLPAATILMPKIYLLLDQDRFDSDGHEKSVNERRANFNYLMDLT